jgi:hypothetical protein
MSFADHPIMAGQAGLTVNGLTLSKTAALTLEVASGDVTPQQTGITSTLATAQSHVFVPDATNPKQVYMAIIDNGTTVDLWVDSYVDDGSGSTVKGDPPAGYRAMLPLAWFTLPANETDLDNVVMNRRVYQ